jgi:hypothetical protein
VSRALEELLRELAVADRGVDVSLLVDDIEARVEDDPEGSRTAVWSFAGDEATRLRLIGFLGDPRDFDVLAAGLADAQSRYTGHWRVSRTNRTPAGSTLWPGRCSTTLTRMFVPRPPA